MATAVMNVKVPSTVADQIDRLATRAGSTKTAVVITLLNDGLAAARRRGLGR